MLLTAARKRVVLGAAIALVFGTGTAVLLRSLPGGPSPSPAVTAAPGVGPRPSRLAPGVVPGAPPAADDPPPSRPEHVAADMEVTAQMLVNLDDTLAELKRERKFDEVAMVERKQAELRGKLKQSKQRLARIATHPAAPN